MYPPKTTLIFTINNKVLHHIPIGREANQYVQSKIDLYLQEVGERGIINPNNVLIYVVYKSKNNDSKKSKKVF